MLCPHEPLNRLLHVKEHPCPAPPLRLNVFRLWASRSNIRDRTLSILKSWSATRSRPGIGRPSERDERIGSSRADDHAESRRDVLLGQIVIGVALDRECLPAGEARVEELEVHADLAGFGYPHQASSTPFAGRGRTRRGAARPWPPRKRRRDRPTRSVPADPDGVRRPARLSALDVSAIRSVTAGILSGSPNPLEDHPGTGQAGAQTTRSYRVEIEQGEDGRFLAEVIDLPASWPNARAPRSPWLMPRHWRSASSAIASSTANGPLDP